MIAPLDHPSYRDERCSPEEIEAAEARWREAIEHIDDAGPRAISFETLESSAQSQDKTGAKRQWLQAWKPSEFMNFTPPADFVLMGDCHLTRGNLTVISGWPGVGKSRAAMAMAIAGASGADWLGHPIHSRFRTLIIQCENGPFRLKAELGAATPGDDDEVLDDWLRITPPPTYGLAFSEPSFRAELRRYIAEWQPGLVIIDPWNRAADGDKQQDYRQALDSIFACLPEDPAQKPALLVIHHMRKKGNESNRKHGRDLLHELAGSYQIGAAARCVFALEPASKDLSDGTVVLTCCKNNDGLEGAPSAWHRKNGLFDPCPEFDMEGFLNPTEESAGTGSRLPFEAVAQALRGMSGETKGSAVARLVNAGVCVRSTGYKLLAELPENIVEDAMGKFWWKEDPEA
ncbi:AAA family ATPase [Haloferula sp. BvORR071]|uniref:AAA family ATPase n=1 Tax=Haloferula sp. BvORR071 TaxID=1396141 RepID=UPI0005522FFC|nr:AAA family ATPase [Haloferula sp. BvORR071]